MVLWERYLNPTSIQEAMQALQGAAYGARVIAGGTDLLLEIQQGRRPPVHTLIDITRIPELQTIDYSDDEINLGAAATHRAILENPLLNREARCLVEACALIGGPQVRNVATIGGNVAHALPAGDGTIALLALDAQAQLATADGTLWKPLEELFAAPGKPTFDPGREMLVGFRFRRQRPSEATAFRRVMRPQGVAIAILNMAVWVRKREDGALEDIRLAVGPAGPTPFRARRTEEVLRGGELTAQSLEHAQQTLLDEARVRASPHRATADYRRLLLGVLLERVLVAAGALGAPSA